MSQTFSYLSQGERERLRRLPFPVALPQKLPEGWQAQTLEITQDEENIVEAPFLGPGNARVVVITADGGISDVIEGDSPRSREHDLFGTIVVSTNSDSEASESQSCWFPIEVDEECYHCFTAENVPDEELWALVDSLARFGSE